MTNEELKSINEKILIEFKNFCIQYPNEAVANLWNKVVDNYFPKQGNYCMCVICGKVPVDLNDGYDTCFDCASKTS
jgi:hypothetical protein